MFSIMFMSMIMCIGMCMHMYTRVCMSMFDDAVRVVRGYVYD